MSDFFKRTIRLIKRTIRLIKPLTQTSEDPEKKYYFKIPYNSDEELNEYLNNFNNFLRMLIKKYNLNQSEVNKLMEMFRDGKSFTDIEAYAMQLGQEHQRQG